MSQGIKDMLNVGIFNDCKEGSRNLKRWVPVVNSFCSWQKPSQNLSHRSFPSYQNDLHKKCHCNSTLESNLCLVVVEVNLFPLGFAILGNLRQLSGETRLLAEFQTYLTQTSLGEVPSSWTHLRDKVGCGNESEKEGCHHWCWSLPGCYPQAPHHQLQAFDQTGDHASGQANHISARPTRPSHQVMYWLIAQHIWISVLITPDSKEV